MYVCILNQFAVHPKLTQYCKSTILQFLKKEDKYVTMNWEASLRKAPREMFSSSEAMGSVYHHLLDER